MQQTSDPLIKTDHALRLGVGDMAKISNHNFFFFFISRFHDFIMILCHVGFTILSEQSTAKLISLLQRQILSRSQNIKMNGGYLGQSGPRWESLSLFYI